MSTASAKILQMHEFQGDADVRFTLNPFVFRIAQIKVNKTKSDLSLGNPQ